MQGVFKLRRLGNTSGTQAHHLGTVCWSAAAKAWCATKCGHFAVCCAVLSAVRRPDHEQTKLAKDSTPIDYPKPDGVTTFDVPTSLFRSGMATAVRKTAGVATDHA
jgi:hypothetical protein